MPAVASWMGRPAMRRFFTLMLFGLTMAVVPIVGAVVWQSASFARTAPVIDTADPAVGFAFYAGIERLLAGERGSGLSGIVSDDFGDHAKGASQPRPVGALIDDLVALESSFPGIGLGVDSIRADGDNLIAMVTLTTPAPGQIAGLSVTRPAVTPGIEILHVRRGLVSERWASWLPAPALTTLDGVTYWDLIDTTLNTRLFRITLPVDSGLSWNAYDVAIVMAEAGSIEATFEVTDDAHRPVRQTKTFAAGEAVSIPRGATARFESGDERDARVLLFAAHIAGEGLSWPFQLDGEARSERLWASNGSLHVTSPWQIAIGQLVLPANTDVRLGNTAGVSLLLAAQLGSPELSAADGTARQLNDRGVTVTIGSPNVMQTDSAVEIEGAQSVHLSTAFGEPSTVWLVTIGPVEPRDAESAVPKPTPSGPGPRP